MQNRLTNLESMHEQLNNQCRSLEYDKQALEEERNNYRQQLEDTQSGQSEQSSVDKEQFSITRNDDYEQYQLSIRSDNQSGLNTLFQHLPSTVNEANEWRINLSKPLRQVNGQQFRAFLRIFVFVG